MADKPEAVKHYETDLRTDNQFGNAPLPDVVRFSMSIADAEEIQRLSDFVSKNGLYKVEKFDSRASWLTGDPDDFIEASTDANILNISKDAFWFSAYLKHSEVQILSDRQSIQELVDWCVNVDKAAATEKEQSFFRVELKFANAEYGENDPQSIPNGVWTGLADSKEDAEKHTYDAHWDRRLDVTGCTPVYETSEIPRYVASDSWGHIFVGKSEDLTRWVYDRAKDEIIAGQVISAGNWVDLEAPALADVLESVKDNDALIQLDEFNLTEFMKLPTWEEVESANQEDAQPEYQRG